MKFQALAVTGFLLAAVSPSGSSQEIGIQVLTNREVLLLYDAPAGTRYRIDASTNLADWIPLLTAESTGTDAHPDAAAAYLPQRFYRAVQVEGDDFLAGDHLVTTNGVAIIHPVNHASFLLRWNGLMVYNDPVGGAAPYAGLPRADLILVSHSHGDHFNAGTLDAVRGPEGVIVVPQNVFNMLPPPLQAAALVLTNGGHASLMGLEIEAVPAYNANHPRGQGNGYVLTIGGRRLYMSGDTGDIPEMRALPNIDVAFVCMNLPFTMSVPQAAGAVREFRPRIVYPYHYRNQDSSFADLEEFKRQVGTDLGIEVRMGNWY